MLRTPHFLSAHENISKTAACPGCQKLRRPAGLSTLSHDRRFCRSVDAGTRPLASLAILAILSACDSYPRVLGAGVKRVYSLHGLPLARLRIRSAGGLGALRIAMRVGFSIQPTRWLCVEALDDVKGLGCWGSMSSTLLTYAPCCSRGDNSGGDHPKADSLIRTELLGFLQADSKRTRTGND